MPSSSATTSRKDPGPRKGHLRGRLPPAKHTHVHAFRPTPQQVLEYNRLRLICALRSDHALRTRLSDCGGLLDDQPPTKRRETVQDPQLFRRRKKTKSKDDPKGALHILERNRVLAMWNGVGRRTTSNEKEWQDRARVRAKLVLLREKHGLRNLDLRNEEDVKSLVERCRRQGQRQSRHVERIAAQKVVEDIAAADAAGATMTR